jgi:hypothetical protein
MANNRRGREAAVGNVLDPLLRQRAPDIAEVCGVLDRNTHYVQQDNHFFDALPVASKEAYRISKCAF